MNKLDEAIVNSINSPYLLKRYHAWFHTDLGAFMRWILLVWTTACFAVVGQPLIMGIALIGVVYMPAAGLSKRVSAFAKFLYMPTPSQFVRSYNKIWPSVKNGPIQKTIKQP
jgi:hypothetical protein